MTYKNGKQYYTDFKLSDCIPYIQSGNLDKFSDEFWSIRSVKHGNMLRGFFVEINCINKALDAKEAGETTFGFYTGKVFSDLQVAHVLDTERLRPIVEDWAIVKEALFKECNNETIFNIFMEEEVKRVTDYLEKSCQVKLSDGSLLTKARIDETFQRLQMYETLKENNEFDTFYYSHLAVLEEGLKELQKKVLF